MLSFSTTFGVTGLLVTLLLRRGRTEIQPTEVISWSWGSLGHSFIKGTNLRNAVLIGLFYGIFYGALVWVVGNAPPFAGVSLDYWGHEILSMVVIVSAVSWLLTGLFGGWSSEKLDERKLTKPNQGIRRSAYYAILFGVMSWLVYGVITWLVRYVASYTPLTRWILPDEWLHSWLLYGTLGALAIALYNGGLAFIKHVVLRVLLWRARNMPWKYPRFLDYAAEHILLRKVGGGYIFAHRLLLEYFAQLQTEPPLRSKKWHKTTDEGQPEPSIPAAFQKQEPITVEQVQEMSTHGAIDQTRQTMMQHQQKRS
jgi:hypothetical protein